MDIFIDRLTAPAQPRPDATAERRSGAVTTTLTFHNLPQPPSCRTWKTPAPECKVYPKVLSMGYSHCHSQQDLSPATSSLQQLSGDHSQRGTSWNFILAPPGPNQPAETQPLTSHGELLVQLVYTAQVTGPAGRCKQDTVFMALNSCPDKPIRPRWGRGALSCVRDLKGRGTTNCS